MREKKEKNKYSTYYDRKEAAVSLIKVLAKEEKYDFDKIEYEIFRETLLGEKTIKDLFNKLIYHNEVYIDKEDNKVKLF